MHTAVVCGLCDMVLDVPGVLGAQCWYFAVCIAWTDGVSCHPHDDV